MAEAQGAGPVYTLLTHPNVQIDPAVAVPRWPLSERGRARHPASDHIPGIVRMEERLPGIRLQLLDSEREPTFLGLDVQDHRLRHLPFLQQLRGVLDALGPGEVADVHQPVNAFLDLEEHAEIGQLAHTAFHHAAH